MLHTHKRETAKTVTKQVRAAGRRDMGVLYAECDANSKYLPITEGRKRTAIRGSRQWRPRTLVLLWFTLTIGVVRHYS